MLIVRERSRHCCIILFVSRIRYALALAWRRYRKKLTNMNEACSDLPTFFIGCLWPFKLRRRRRRRQERRQHHRLLVKPIATRAKQNSLCTHTFDALSDRRKKKEKNSIQRLEEDGCANAKHRRHHKMLIPFEYAKIIGASHLRFNMEWIHIFIFCSTFPALGCSAMV